MPCKPRGPLHPDDVAAIEEFTAHLIAQRNAETWPDLVVACPHCHSPVNELCITGRAGHRRYTSVSHASRRKARIAAAETEAAR